MSFSTSTETQIEAMLVTLAVSFHRLHFAYCHCCIQVIQHVVLAICWGNIVMIMCKLADDNTVHTQSCPDEPDSSLK